MDLQKSQLHGIVIPFYYTYFLFEIYTVLKEEDIKNVWGYSFFQLPFWAKILYGCNNKTVEICLNQKKTQMCTTFSSEIFQEHLKCAIAWMDVEEWGQVVMARE